MEGNKIPIWENLKDYPEDLNVIANSLLGFADLNFQKRIWWMSEGPEVDSYIETMLSFDYHISYLKYQIRQKEISLSGQQIKAILRVHAMSNTFNRNEWQKITVRGWDEDHEYLLSHPYWIKITEKAKYALSLLRI